MVKNKLVNTIKRLSYRQAIIYFPEFDVHIFVKFKGPYCSSIRIWKLPPKSSFLSMLKVKNLIWAIYNKDAMFLHGWFSKESNLVKAIADKIVKCKNFDELKGLLIDFEKIINGETPSVKDFLK